MNKLKIFNNQNLGQVRVIEQNGEPYFVLKDVCEVLGLSNTTVVADRLDDDEVTKFNLGGLSGETNIVNESGLYNVILRSDKPQAKQFKKWITSEVLPTIRKHGAYMTADTIEKTLTDPDYLIKLATTLKEEKESREKAERMLEEQKPLVLFAETCITSKDSILIRELAKLASKNGIKIGEKKLYKQLRDWELILKSKNEPSQRAMDMELFEVKKGTYATPYGAQAFATVTVTPKGQIYIIEKLKKSA